MVGRPFLFPPLRKEILLLSSDMVRVSHKCNYSNKQPCCCVKQEQRFAFRLVLTCILEILRSPPGAFVPN